MSVSWALKVVAIQAKSWRNTISPFAVAFAAGGSFSSTSVSSPLSTRLAREY
jgi:hypothetical protein